MAKKDGIESTVGVIEIKLGACLTAPTKRAVKDLHDIALWCNHSRNAMIRYWERWREDHPDWQPEQRRARGGVAKVAKRIAVADGYKKKDIVDAWKKGLLVEKPDGSLYLDGNCVGKNEETAVLENPACSQTLENEMYARGTEVAPKLACSLVSCLRGEVLDRLKSKMPYNHYGEAEFRYEAILKYEVSRDTYRSVCIPAPNSCTVFAYCGNLSRNMSKGIDARLAELSKSSAILRVMCFSREAGRQNSEHIFRIECRQLPRGKRAILMRLATQEWKLCDSKLVFKRDNWFFQLTYKQPVKQLGLTKGNTATLMMNHRSGKNPLSIRWYPSKQTIVQWQLGDSLVLAAEYERLILRRNVLQSRYSTAGTGRKGHGKKRAFRSIKPYNRRASDLVDVFAKNMVAQVLKFCIRHDCGTVLYREPSLMLRKYSWFEEKKIPFNWTGLLNKVKHKLFLNGIDFVVERMGCAEHRELFKTEDTPVEETDEMIKAD